ncbi:MAG: histone deacetylase [Elusimicrobiota bacterium]
MKQQKKIVFSPKYEVDIGSHVFPTSKYRLVKEYLIENSYLSEDNFVEPEPARSETVMEIHNCEYVNKIKNGTLSVSEELQLELPYTKELAEASFLYCGGTILTCEISLENNVGIHLGGGFHHAYPDHGEGFCVFNDVALGAKKMADKGKKVVVIDCDLHQGNGTAFCFKNNPNVFTFSMHQQNNYPLYKEKSDMDVPLKDQTSGKEYNELLEKSLKEIKSKFNFNFAVYVAGSDTFIDDQLGGLSLTIEDLKARDKIVKSETVDCGIPTAVTMAGGYSSRVEDTVKIHSSTVINFLEVQN